MSPPTRVRGKVAKPSAPKDSTVRRPTAEKAKTDEADVEDQTVSLYGDLHGGLTLIRASSVRLVLTFGELPDGQDVLVPLVDWQTYGHQLSAGVEPDEDDKGPLLSSRLLSFDNLAFLLQDLSYDARDAVRLLVSQSRAGVAPVDDRTRYAARMLRLASKHLSTSADELEGLLHEAEGTERAEQAS